MQQDMAQDRIQALAHAGEAGVVIVGAGLAGYTLAKELRKLAPDQAITLVSADAGALYSKPMLSNALAQGHAAQALVQASAAQQSERLGIRVMAACPVRAIHASAHRLETEAGDLPYGQLVLALGARPRRPTWARDDAVLSVNHLDDYARFRERLQPGSRVCIVGAGLVGCEFANDLAAAGHAVTVVNSAALPLANILPEALGHRVMTSLSGLGVDWHCDQAVIGVEPDASGWRVVLRGGAAVHADLVLSAVGLEAETGLARSAGLATGRGITVDRHLATADPHIHALGDCAEVENLWLPYVLPLMQQARSLAATLAGQPTALTLPALPVVVKTPACPLVVCPPPAGAQGAWQAHQDSPEGAEYVFTNPDGAALGFALAGSACAKRRQWAGRVPPLLGG